MSISINNGKYAFLLALNVGEEWVFDNKPTLAEARRHAPPSSRAAYRAIGNAVTNLRRHNPNLKLMIELRESKGSRIPGDQVVVKMLGQHGEGADPEAFERLERQRKQTLEVWKRRKQAEDAPKLPDQLAQAECVDMARRTAGAVRAQIQRFSPDAPKYDPQKVAVLVTAQIRGETIQQLYGESWADQPNPTWLEPTAHYRIKPAGPREWFLIVSRDGRITAGAPSISLLPHHDSACRVHVQEILDEQ